MRKSLLLLGSLVALGGVGTVLAQTQVDGLDLDAINKAAQAHARNLGQFVDQVLGHQAEANADLADDMAALVEGSQAKVKAEAAARAKAARPAIRSISMRWWRTLGAAWRHHPNPPRCSLPLPACRCRLNPSSA
jgi:predicted TIM-barrel fold metal-dependent hydrolase